MAASCFASLEAARIAEAAAVVAAGRDCDAGLGMIAIEELVLSVSSNETLATFTLSGPSMQAPSEVFRPFHLLGLVPLGWRACFLDLFPREAITAFKARFLVTIHDSSNALGEATMSFSSSSGASPTNSVYRKYFTMITRTNINAVYLECRQGPNRRLVCSCLHLRRPLLVHLELIHWYHQTSSFSNGLASSN